MRKTGVFYFTRMGVGFLISLMLFLPMSSAFLLGKFNYDLTNIDSVDTAGGEPADWELTWCMYHEYLDDGNVTGHIRIVRDGVCPVPNDSDRTFSRWVYYWSPVTMVDKPDILRNYVDLGNMDFDPPDMGGIAGEPETVVINDEDLPEILQKMKNDFKQFSSDYCSPPLSPGGREDPPVDSGGNSGGTPEDDICDSDTAPPGCGAYVLCCGGYTDEESGEASGATLNNLGHSLNIVRSAPFESLSGNWGGPGGGILSLLLFSDVNLLDSGFSYFFRTNDNLAQGGRCDGTVSGNDEVVCESTDSCPEGEECVPPFIEPLPPGESLGFGLNDHPGGALIDAFAIPSIGSLVLGSLLIVLVYAIIKVSTPAWQSAGEALYHQLDLLCTDYQAVNCPAVEATADYCQQNRWDDNVRVWESEYELWLAYLEGGNTCAGCCFAWCDVFYGPGGGGFGECFGLCMGAGRGIVRLVVPGVPGQVDVPLCTAQCGANN
jgi:hypothetical protein